MHGRHTFSFSTQPSCRHDLRFRGSRLCLAVSHMTALVVMHGAADSRVLGASQGAPRTPGVGHRPATIRLVADHAHMRCARRTRAGPRTSFLRQYQVLHHSKAKALQPTAAHAQRQLDCLGLCRSQLCCSLSTAAQAAGRAGAQGSMILRPALPMSTISLSDSPPLLSLSYCRAAWFQIHTSVFPVPHNAWQAGESQRGSRRSCGGA